jgi:DNA-binding transcriptional LysR family regulator
LAKRSPTGYQLTDVGQRLLEYAERAEEVISTFERHALAAGTGLTGSVRVTCSSTMADRLARSILIEGFHARYPGLRVEFIITDKYLDLSKGHADIAIRTGEVADENLIGRKIAEVPWAVYATRSYVEHHGRPERTHDLNQHLVVAFDGEIANYAAARWLKSVAPRAKVAARSDNWAAFLTTVKTGVGLAPLPIHHGDREKELVRLIDTEPRVVSQFWLLMHPTCGTRHECGHSSITSLPRSKPFDRCSYERVSRRTVTLPSQLREAATIRIHAWRAASKHLSDHAPCCSCSGLEVAHLRLQDGPQARLLLGQELT